MDILLGSSWLIDMVDDDETTKKKEQTISDSAMAKLLWDEDDIKQPQEQVIKISTEVK